MEDRKSIKKVDDMKKDFLSKLQRQNASILSSSFDDDLVHDMTVLDPEMMSKYSATFIIPLTVHKMRI